MSPHMMIYIIIQVTKKGQREVMGMLEVTGFGTATRKDTHPTRGGHRVKLNGLMHVSPQRAKTVSILWHDDSGGMQHYWNRNVCKFAFSPNNKCRKGDKCHYLHVGGAEMRQLEQKYVVH